MAEENTPAAFLSYAHFDDLEGHVTKFVEGLGRAIRTLLGKPLDIFQDRSHIGWGQKWRDRIHHALDNSVFLIPILTPSFFESEACRDELESFLEREERLRRQDLILPVYFVSSPVLDDQGARTNDYLAAELAQRQYEDWRDLRLKSFRSRQIQTSLENLAGQLLSALNRQSPRPIELVVDRTSGGYQTIMEAVRNAKSWDRVLVKEGVYREAVIIERPVEIVGLGDREKIVIEADDQNGVLFRAGQGRVAHLTIKHLGTCCSGVNVTQGRLRLEDNDITSGGLSCISIQGAARPSVRGNRIHNGRQEGIYIGEGAAGTIEENKIYRNGLAGIAIRTNANPRVRENDIYEGVREGIYIGGGGRGIIENNIIRENQGPGIKIERGGDPTVRLNQVFSNHSGGLVIAAGGNGTIEENNQIHGNVGDDVMKLNV